MDDVRNSGIALAWITSYISFDTSVIQPWKISYLGSGIGWGDIVFLIITFKSGQLRSFKF